MAQKGTLERVIMDVLWAAGRALLVRELMAEVNARTERPLAYTTVQTVADRLVAKGLLIRTQDRNAWRYHPAVSREDHVAGLMLEVLADTQDRGPALTRFAEGMDPADAHRLLEALSLRAMQALQNDQ